MVRRDIGTARFSQARADNAGDDLGEARLNVIRDVAVKLALCKLGSQGNIKRMSVKRAAHAVAWVGQQKTRADYRMQASHVMMGEPTQVASSMLIASGKQELLEQATSSSEERVVGFASHGVVCG